MDLTRSIDAYCERLDPGLWAEPWNAVTNLAFLLAAAVMWRRTGGRGLGGVLSLLLGVIGLASGLFHTLAVAWAGAADSLTILIFVLVYLFAANRRFLGLTPLLSLGGVALAVLAIAMLAPAFALVPGLGASAGYAPLPVLIAAYALWLRQRSPDTARGLALGALLLVLSLAFRTLDGPLCDALPRGTHFLWHLLNALMLAWMIEVHRRAGGAAEEELGGR